MSEQVKLKQVISFQPNKTAPLQLVSFTREISLPFYYPELDISLGVVEAEKIVSRIDRVMLIQVEAPESYPIFDVICWLQTFPVTDKASFEKLCTALPKIGFIRDEDN